MAVPSHVQDQHKLDHLRHYRHYRDGQPGDSPYAGGSSFMERVSEKVASGMGTVGFIIVSSGLIVVWVLSNGAVHYISATITAIGHGNEFDPEPWILLNLIFSAVAFYTGALVIIAQKAQTRTDKANEDASARHRDELSQADAQQRCARRRGRSMAVIRGRDFGCNVSGRPTS